MGGPRGGIKDQGWGNGVRKWEAVDQAPGRSDTKQSRNVFRWGLYGPGSRAGGGGGCVWKVTTERSIRRHSQGPGREPGSQEGSTGSPWGSPMRPESCTEPHWRALWGRGLSHPSPQALSTFISPHSAQLLRVTPDKCTCPRSSGCRSQAHWTHQRVTCSQCLVLRQLCTQPADTSQAAHGLAESSGRNKPKYLPESCQVRGRYILSP